MSDTATLTPDDDGQDKKKRGRRGEGTIYWDAVKGEFRGELSLGYAPSGKRKRVRVYGATKSEVRDKFKEAREEHENGVKGSNKYTVADAVDDWLKRGLNGRNPKTVDKLRTLAYGHVVPSLGKAKLRKLEADDVDDWLAIKKERLATRTLKDILAILRRAIAHAQRRNRVLRNVAELVEVPEGQAGRPSKALPIDQAATLLEASKRTSIHAYLVLSLLTGIRTEEARALTWKRVHLQPGDGLPPYVEVWRSVRKGGDTKTRRSRRTLALPAPVVAVLAAHRAKQDKLREKAGKHWHDKGLVFATRFGTELDAHNVRRALRIALKKAKLPPDWTPRELRHSFVSLMSAAGAPVELIARLVGHSDTNTTETVYRHELRPVITEGAEIMEQLFKAHEGDDSER